MALMDNEAFLIAHIRNSFITSDDTGMCELILDSTEHRERPSSTGEKRPNTWHAGKGSVEEESGSFSDDNMDTELAHSFDIPLDMDFSAHRRRSNTAQRLEKLKRERQEKSQIRHVHWRQAAQPVSEVAELFEKREMAQLPVHNNKSMLTLQLQQMKEQTHNPFSRFAKHDGKASGGQPVKKIDIFLTMATPQDRPYPMAIVTLATTKVEELIGLICWQYTREEKLPQLLDSVDCYALHIAEDDGEVDLDFPALDNREPISKFGFAKLALVERDIPRRHMSSTVVTIYMPNRGFSKIPIDDDSIVMKELLDKVLARRKLKQIKGLEYRLEKQNEPGAVIDLEKPLRQMPTMEFCLVRENSTRADVSEESEAEGHVSAITVSLTSHQYKSYNVVMLHKIASNVPVQLGISGEKVEIDPKQSKGVLFKQKAMTCDIDDIASCELLSVKEKSGKLTLRLVCCQGSDFKHYDFECLASVAKEIVNKINNIMELRSSPKKKEYQVYRERKLQNPFKRHSLSFS